MYIYAGELKGTSIEIYTSGPESVSTARGISRYEDCGAVNALEYRENDCLLQDL